jgi:hypothetical protein
MEPAVMSGVTRRAKGPRLAVDGAAMGPAREKRDDPASPAPDRPVQRSQRSPLAMSGTTATSDWWLTQPGLSQWSPLVVGG